MLNKYLVPVIALGVFLLDRLTKLLLPVPKVLNHGAAFGILTGQGLFLSLFSLLVVISLSIFMARTKTGLSMPIKLGIAMIIGGTLGNLYDRMFLGYVVDFINLGFLDFPVFNIADVFINTGAGLLLITLPARK